MYRTPAGRLSAVQVGSPADLSGSVACMDAGKEREQGRGSFAPTKKPRIVTLRKIFTVKQMGLKNMQSNE